MKCEFGNTHIEYQEHGTGRPILMLHGGRLDHRHMQSAMEPLFVNRPGWKRIYLDYPGHGDSPSNASIQSIQDVLECLLVFVKQVFAGENFVIAGMSRGGYLARGLLYHHGDRIDGVLFEVPSVTAAGDETLLPARKILSRSIDFTKTLTGKQRRVANALLVSQNADTLAALRADFIPAIERADNSHHRTIMDNYRFSIDIDAVPSKFEKPVLFLLGRQDDSVGYHDAWHILEQFPRASFVVLDKAGHLLQIEQPELFQTLVGEWLDRVETFGNEEHQHAVAFGNSLHDANNHD